MNILTLTFGAGWIGILVDIAIVCVVIWAIFAFIQWIGWTIPEPVRIFFIAVIAIVVVLLIAKLAMMLLSGV